MPNRPSAKKQVRQDEKRRLRNRAAKSEARTLMKRVKAAVSNDDAALAEKELRLAHSKLDKIAKKNIWHKNHVARKKAQLTKLVATLKSS